MELKICHIKSGMDTGVVFVCSGAFENSHMYLLCLFFKQSLDTVNLEALVRDLSA